MYIVHSIFTYFQVYNVIYGMNYHINLINNLSVKMSSILMREI